MIDKGDGMRALGKLSSRTIGVIGLSIVTGILLLWLQMEEIEPEPQHPVMGIVSTLAEDQRKDAQMAELIQTAEQDGFDVLPMPVERTQASQIEAIRALIVYQVDVIVFVPLVEDGWENVMHEADTAGIPLLAIDKSMEDSIWGQAKHYVGYDYCTLAEQATDALIQHGPSNKGVIELYGTLNSYDAREIARGCREGLELQGKEILYSLCGDGMRSRGYEIMESLQDHLDEIGYVICHNDAMALGALDYLEESGRIPGKEVFLCAFGGGEDTYDAFKDGRIQVLVQLDDRMLAEKASQAAYKMIAAPRASFDWIVSGKVLTKGNGA